ncbi:MAG TPA: heparinase II/III family protein, partial [candidate division Zixibacteria bacterium]|nr:heparinase II/III family protein [candidate division Zixibacteria bacterium]
MNPLTILRRTLAADPHELTTRLAQARFVSANRRAARSGRSAFPAGAHLVSLGESRETLRRWFACRKHRWFLDPDRCERIVELYDNRDQERSLILRRADLVVNGKMPIFSHEPVEFIGPERWRRDHILGVTAPQVFYGNIEYLNAAQVGDSKNVWEPNRFGWVYWLGQASVITGEPVYAETLRALLLDWRAQNPYPLGVNYCSALELAFRAYALVWALDFFADLFARNAELLDAALEIIWVSCSHIERLLSYYFAPNTHLTGEAFALFACGAALPEFAESASWRSLGMEILSAEAGKQFHEDGTHRELSTCYHLYSTDFYLHAALIARHTGFAAPVQIEHTARLLAERMAELAPEDLHLPQINDCDGGRLSWFAFHPLDTAPALFAAQELWDDFALPATDRHAAGYALWMTDLLA